ncbi:MAG: rRNA ((1498)-N(3))-methyltransferase, partial [Caulobacter sp.]|nr:rRNA ((1498)-N(3))-methyltransferase [Caulobacter sp.]
DHIKQGRLEAIAIEASEQTGRVDVPEIVEPRKLDRLLDDWDPGRRLVFCDEGGQAAPMAQALAGSGQPAAVLIGPEGGFAPEERERLRAAAFVTPVSLGPRILRADTAAIAALTLWQTAAGDWR